MAQTQYYAPITLPWFRVTLLVEETPSTFAAEFHLVQALDLEHAVKTALLNHTLLGGGKVAKRSVTPIEWRPE